MNTSALSKERMKHKQQVDSELFINATKKILSTNIAADTYTKNRITLLNYKLEHNEPLTEFEIILLIMVWSKMCSIVGKEARDLWGKNKLT